jgi:dynein heavy chain 1
MEILQSFPMKSLVSATSVTDIIAAIAEIFVHFDAFRNKTNYLPGRINILARAAARDVADQLSIILSKHIMIMKYNAFVAKTANIERLFDSFSNKYNRLRADLRQRELLRSTNQKFSSAWRHDSDTELNGMQKRVQAIKAIRKAHSELSHVIGSTFASADKRTLTVQTDKVREAYSVFKKLDALRCPEREWHLCVELYTNKINEVETEIQGMIRLAMEEATDARDMFRVCEKYNKLFVRDRIRQAVWEFQSVLLTNIQAEVKSLQQRYRKQYRNIHASKLSHLRGIPPVSGEVIWCRQLLRQLVQNENRLKAVLGEHWHQSPNARELAESMNTFKIKLDPNKLVKKWEIEAKSLPNFDDSSPIFAIETGLNRTLSLSIAFDDNYAQLFKEVRCLVSLGVRIDISLHLSCIDVKQKYPIATKLKDAVAIFGRTCREIEGYANRDGMMGSIDTLLDRFKHQCQRQISVGAHHRWFNHQRDLNNYVAALSQSMISLQENSQKAYELSLLVDQTLTSLKTCPLTVKALNSRIAKLQSIVDKLDNGGFHAVPFWCAALNEKLEAILLARVDEILNGYMQVLDEDWTQEAAENESSDDEDSKEEDANAAQRASSLKVRSALRHSIKISSSQRLVVEPPIADARMKLGQDLQSMLTLIVEQPRPRSDSDDDHKSETTFRLILNQINIEKVVDCYKKIEDICGKADRFANTWLSYQALWDMDLLQVFDTMGDDIANWIRLMNDMKASQSSSGKGSGVEKCFGPISVYFGNVRNKVESKYLEFRKKTFQALRTRLGDQLRAFHHRVTNGKHVLEDTSFTVATTEEIIRAVTALQNLREESSQWNEQWQQCEEAEKLLLNNRYNLGPTWMYASRIRAVLNDFFTVLDMRWTSLKYEATNIYQKLEEQFAIIAQDTQQLEAKWHAEKPVQGWASTWTDAETVDWLRDYEGGILRPLIETFRTKGGDGQVLHAISKRHGVQKRHALIRSLEITDEQQQNNLITAMDGLLFTHSDVHHCLQEFEDRVTQITESYVGIRTARNAMKVVVDSIAGDDDSQVEAMLGSITKEMHGLAEVHKALTLQWSKLHEIGRQPFLRLDIRELGKALREIQEELAKLPNKMRTYEVYGKFVDILNQKQKMTKNILGDLCAGGIESPILKHKHWCKIFKLLSIKKSNANSLIVEDLWSINLNKYMQELTAITLVAQGENALQKFLEELEEKWQMTLFELVD